MTVKYIISNLQQAFLNKVTLFTVLIHWTIVIIAFYIRGGWNLQIHFYYEPLLSKILLLLNLPAITIAESLSMPLNTLIAENYPLKTTVIFVLSITVQWVLIGYVINKLFLHSKRVQT